jgi:hypothetical protein
MANLERIEVVKCGPYRFIGKVVYFRNDWGNEGSQTAALQTSVWIAKKWIFETLDAMTEYIATDMPYGGGLYMWDRYDDRSQLQGFIAKGWGGYCENELYAKLNESNEYIRSGFWNSEVYPNFESLGKGDYAAGYFTCCTLKDETQA